MMKWMIRIVAVVVLYLGIQWMIPWFYSDIKQMQRAQEQLLLHASNRQWGKVAMLLADDYSDKLNATPVEAIEGARELFQGFLVLDIAAHEPQFEVRQYAGSIKTSLKVTGRGAGMSSALAQRMNQLEEPWTFEWVKSGMGPRSWRLKSLDHVQMKRLR